MVLLHEAFERQVADRPAALALTAGSLNISYAQLNARANRLAHALIEHGVTADMPVGLCLEMSPEYAPDLIAGILAILKAGGGYVPLDPSLPSGRLALIVDQAAPAVVLTSENLLDHFEKSTGELLSGQPSRRVLCVDRDAALIDAQPESNLRLPVERDHLCYVMFTSGSTGRPKGVMVTHGNVAGLFDGIGESLGLGPDDVWTLFHTFAFGFSVWEIWGALRHGGRLVLLPAKDRADPVRIFQIIREQHVTVLSQTPSAFRQVLSSSGFPEMTNELDLRLVVLSGEPAQAQDLAAWFTHHGETGPRIANTYAITETGGQVSFREYAPGQSSGDTAQSIGRAVPHARLFVVDENLQPVEHGASGELCVGGPGIARGYINDPELTNEKFLRLRLNGSDPERIYRTGDQVRWLDDELQFVGRVDDQVKVRGYRIEPGEIESVLRTHPCLSDAAVTVHGDSSDDRRLAAYVTSAERAEFWPSLGPYQLYDEFLYDLMSAESKRLDSYRRAYRNCVRDRVVLDIGAGEHALLARMCIEEGATRVYAVEVLEEAAQKAEALVNRLGLADRIHVIHGDIASINLPEKIDVCTQGIIGNIGSADGIIPVWNAARRFFQSACVPVPYRCRTMIAPVQLPPELHDQPGFGALARSYVDKAFEQAGRPFDIRLCVKNFPVDGLIASPVSFEDLDFTDSLPVDSSGSHVFIAERDARFDGFLLWTVVMTTAGEEIDYLDTQQAWLPVFFPVPDAGFALGRDDRIATRWWRQTQTGVSPDYRLDVSVEKAGENAQDFVMQSCFDERTYRGTALHRALWTAGESPDHDASPAALRKWLAARLPDYMIPSIWTQLAALPLNHNGKLDRSALPEPARGRETTTVAYVAPRGGLECDLAGIFTEVLGIDRIGVRDDFFDLGGDSIAAVRLTSALQRLLDDAVMLVAVFNAPTIEALAVYLAQNHGASVDVRYPGSHSPVSVVPEAAMEQGEI